MMKKSALILGGNRFFGRHLARDLVNRGLDVTLLNRGRVDDGLGEQVSRLVADRSDSSQLSKVLGDRSWDFVFDQICFNGEEAASLAKILDGRTERLIFTSTASVYGRGRGLHEANFNSQSYVPTEPRKKDYASLKREAETAYLSFPNLHVAIARIPIVLGLDDPTGRLRWHVDRVMRGLPIRVPNLAAHIGFIRSDVAGRLLAEIAMTSFEGAVNIASPGDISVQEILAVIERATGKSANLVDFENDENAPSVSSPFGVEDDWTMDLSQMQRLGLEAPPLDAWFEPLVQELTEVSRTMMAKGL